MRGLSTLTALPLLFVAVAQGALFYEASVQNFDLVNDLRKSEGSSALQWNENLYQKALQWSKQMFEEDRLHHSDYNLAENVAFG